MPFRDVPSLMEKLSARSGVSPLAVRFAALTAARTGEALGATWDQIDLDNAVWVVPAELMKGGRQHRVPLSSEAIGILEQLRRCSSGTGYVFTGRDGGKLANGMLLQTIRMAGVAASEATVHGFRSSFRDWAATRGYQRELAELSLAHSVGSKVEQSYWRDDLLEQRRPIMEAWAEFCCQPAAEIIPIRVAR